MAIRDFESPAGVLRSQPVEIVTDRLETPSLDDRQYRVIRLPNNLEALLVHDAETDKASAALDCNVGNFSDEDDMPGMAHAVEHVSIPLALDAPTICFCDFDIKLPVSSC